MRLKSFNWRRLMWITLSVGALAVCLLVFASNRFLYFSHQRLRSLFEVRSYDSNDPRDLEYCAECGVRGLIVDDPKAAMSQFRDWGETP
jgi:hypothetical protein